MRYAVVADIHANLEALNAVLERIDTLGVDRIVCCGDLVGYYSNPNECIELLRERNVLAVRGNHDVAAAGLREMVAWEVAVRAIDWTRPRLSEENRRFLGELPATRVVDGRFLLFHGALHPPERGEDLHLHHEEDVLLTLDALVEHPARVNLAFFGHVHRRDAYRRAAELDTIAADRFALEAGYHYIVNPGSVGQPRDGTAAASFLVYDADAGEICYESVAFDGAACLRKARREGLLQNPARQRLAVAVRGARRAAKLLRRVGRR